MMGLISDRRARQIGGVSLAGFGILIAWFSAPHALSGEYDIFGRVLGVLAIVGMAVPLVSGGGWIWRRDPPLGKLDVVRVLAWCWSGMVPLVGFAALFIGHQQGHGIQVVEPAVTILWIAGGGAVGGLLTGVYDLRRDKAQRRQQAAADRLSSLVAAAPVPIVEHSPDGRVRRWNNAAEEVFGWRADEVLGEQLPFRAEGQSVQAGLEDGVVGRERVTNVEIRQRTKDGEEREFLLSRAVTDGEEQSPGSIIDVLVDVTQQNEQREKLQLFRTLLDHSDDSIFVIDAETGRLVDVNETACQRLGYAREELFSRVIVDVTARWDTIEEWREYVASLREDEGVIFESTHERKDGSTFPVEVDVTHVTLDQEYAVAIARDITNRKERKQELKRLKRAVEHAGHAIYVTDADGGITYANPAFEAVTGYGREEVIGETPGVLSSGEHDEEYYQRLWETILDGNVWEEEVINRRKSGELYTARQTIAPIHDGDDIVGFVAIQSDKTAKQMREQRITVLNRILRHNLRNYVNVIYGHVNRLDSEETDHERHVSKIRKQAHKLEQLSEKARTVTEALENTRPPGQPVPVTDLLDQISATVKPSETEIAVSYPGAEDISIDASIEPAVRELVENAIKHTDQPNASIRINATVEDQQISIAVADTGPGIPDLERATLRDGDERPLQHGRGLGLWLVKWITNSLGGKVDIDDNDPRGSVVTLTVPVMSNEDLPRTRPLADMP
jgi:PAS domain S-box-containing protein